jgi:integrase
MKTLRETLQAYITLRQDLGCKYDSQARCLRHFVTFMEARCADRLTTQLMLAWATTPASVKASTRSFKLQTVRGFARHCHADDPRHEVPPPGLLASAQRPQPYLYTAEEVQTLMRSARADLERSEHTRETYHCLIGLLSVTGLRINEALNLKRQDVDLDMGILTIHRSKFGKTRLVALHASTCVVLIDYAKHRDERPSSSASDYFFVGDRGRRLYSSTTAETFARLSRLVGLRDPMDATGPRLHDFRHRFAVQTLLNWYRRGEDVERLLPVLTTYLGHSYVRHTYWYLSACPELMDHAAQRLDACWGDRP